MEGLIILFWIMCGFVGAGAAQQRGFSWVAGLLLGLILGPVGVLISFFLGSGAAQPAISIADERHKCPRCAEWIMVDALVCRFCGHELQIEGDGLSAADCSHAESDERNSDAGDTDTPAWREWSSSFPK